MLAHPPPAATLAGGAIVDAWTAGRPIIRAHPHLYGSAQLDGRSAADARFSTIRSAGSVIPVAYGGGSAEAAASETIFHTVDTPAGAHRPRRVFLAQHRSWQWSTVLPARDLSLVRLDGVGLVGLGTTRADLIEGGRPSYRRTRLWAAALAEALPGVDGLWWMSRQAPDERAVLLFGRMVNRRGGIGPGDLAADAPALPFASTAGVARLDEIASRLDVTVIRS